MAGSKRSKDGKLATRFIPRLAKELASDSESGFRLASNTQALKEALQKSADSLPSGKLRATLQHILEQESQHETFIASLQLEIRVRSAKLELHGDILLTSSASERLFETLLDCIHGKTASFATDVSGNHALSHDEVLLLLARNPAPHILWALAAMKCTYADGVRSCDSASTLFHCLKPWIVDRSASIAMATMAPLVPFMFESLKQAGRDASKLKTLHTVVKEFLSFTVAVNYKEHFTKRFTKRYPREVLSFSSLLDGFLAVFKAFELQGADTETETPSIPEKLNRMFPLASEIMTDALKPSNVRIGFLADIVKAEFLLLYMVVEVLYSRQKSKGGDKMVKRDIGALREQVGRIAVNGLAAGQSDLLLDSLLTDLSSLNNILDDEEKSLICVSIFKAVVINRNGFLEKNSIETLSKNKKGLEGFLKRISVARKFAIKQRSNYDILEGVACYLTVPPKLMDYLKSGKIRRSLSRKETRNHRAIIGWLVQLDESDFQALVNGARTSFTQVDEKMRHGKDDVGNAKDVGDEAEVEDLFFLDTTGEELAQDTPASFRRSKRSKKRKAKQVLFHRQGLVTKVKEEDGLSEGLSDSSSGVRKKMRNGEESSSPLHGSVDDLKCTADSLKDFKKE